jgi:hypothetical protein
MVTAKTQHNLKNAEEYFEEHLCVGDYYDQGQRVAGEWIGLGAERLGLSGKVRAEDFLRLCENQHPATGEKLTPELNLLRLYIFPAEIGFHRGTDWQRRTNSGSPCSRRQIRPS